MVLLFLICFIVVTSNIVNVKKYSKITDNICKNYDLDNRLILAIIKVESNFDKNAKSQKGARGLMQLKIETFDYVKSIEKFNENLYIFNEEDNILVGTAYFKYLLNKFKDIEVSLCAFNAGEGKVNGWLKNREYSIDGITLDYIPYNETRNYVKKVTFYYELYSRFLK